MNNQQNIIVKGKKIDDATRCVHYHSPLDIIAIRMKCCDTYYPCIFCHQETAGHDAEVWKKEEFEEQAILCGACKTPMSITQYLQCNYHCPFCNAAFNPGCSNHNHFYFET
ncbi:CHY zinc finger protein [Ferruginibacter sp.]